MEGNYQLDKMEPNSKARQILTCDWTRETSVKDTEARDNKLHRGMLLRMEFTWHLYPKEFNNTDSLILFLLLLPRVITIGDSRFYLILIPQRNSTTLTLWYCFFCCFLVYCRQTLLHAISIGGQSLHRVLETTALAVRGAHVCPICWSPQSTGGRRQTLKQVVDNIASSTHLKTLIAWSSCGMLFRRLGNNLTLTPEGIQLWYRFFCCYFVQSALATVATSCFGDNSISSERTSCVSNMLESTGGRRQTLKQVQLWKAHIKN